MCNNGPTFLGLEVHERPNLNGGEEIDVREAEKLGLDSRRPPATRKGGLERAAHQPAPKDLTVHVAICQRSEGFGRKHLNLREPHDVNRRQGTHFGASSGPCC